MGLFIFFFEILPMELLKCISLFFSVLHRLTVTKITSYVKLKFSNVLIAQTLLFILRFLTFLKIIREFHSLVLGLISICFLYSF